MLFQRGEGRHEVSLLRNFQILLVLHLGQFHGFIVPLLGVGSFVFMYVLRLNYVDSCRSEAANLNYIIHRLSGVSCNDVTFVTLRNFTAQPIKEYCFVVILKSTRRASHEFLLSTVYCDLPTPNYPPKGHCALCVRTPSSTLIRSSGPSTIGRARSRNFLLYVSHFYRCRSQALERKNNCRRRRCSVSEFRFDCY